MDLADSWRLGVTEAYEVYRKVANGRVTFHRWRNNTVIERKAIPEGWLSHIVTWDNAVDEALASQNTTKKLEQTRLDRLACEAQIVDLEKQLLARPADYSEQLAAATALDQGPYYHTMSTAGIPRYYAGGKVVKRADIPKDIQTNGVPLKTMRMLQSQEFKAIDDKIVKARDRIRAIDDQRVILRNYPLLPGYTDILRRHDQRVTEIQAKIKTTNLRFLASLSTGARAQPRPTPRPPPPPRDRKEDDPKDKTEAERVLKSLDIKSKLGWKKWLAAHHTDKNGSKGLTQMVLDAGHTVYPDINTNDD